MTSAEIVEWTNGKACGSITSKSIHFGEADLDSAVEQESNEELVDDLGSLPEEIKGRSSGL